MITPNMLRVGRSNERSLDGPMRLPSCVSELTGEVEKIYSSWFKIWNTTYVPKLMKQPKWFKQDRDLSEGDIVMFQKSDPGIDSRWLLGTVDQVVHGRDKLARRVIVKYQNSSEDHHRLTDRSIRSLVKVWSCDDLNLDEDLAVLQEKLSSTVAGSSLVHMVRSLGCSVPPVQLRCGVGQSRCERCCCVSHCKLSHAEEEDGSLQSLLSVFSVEMESTLVQSVVDEDDDEEAMVESQAYEEESLNGMLNSLSYLC